MIKYISNGTWFDIGSIVRLVDDFRPSMDSGLFIGYCDGEMDSEICSFDEFDEVEIEKMDMEVDKAYDYHIEWWEKRRKQLEDKN